MVRPASCQLCRVEYTCARTKRLHPAEGVVLRATPDTLDRAVKHEDVLHWWNIASEDGEPGLR